MQEKIYTHPIGRCSINPWGDYDTLVHHLTRPDELPPYIHDNEEWRLQSSIGAAPKRLTPDEVREALYQVFFQHATLALDK